MPVGYKTQAQIPVANALPIPACAWPHADRDVFPSYVEQPGTSADDYIGDPDYLAEASF
jgi:hypothetical protein